MSKAHVTIDEPWAQVPEALIYGPLSATAVRVYAAIRRHGSDPENCYPSHERIATLIGVHRDTVKRAVAELIEAGWIESFPRYDGLRQTANGYRVYSRLHGRGGCTHTPPGGCTHAPGGGAPVPHERESFNESHRNETPVVPTTNSHRQDVTTPAAQPEPPGFSEWWTTYPRKAGKGAARKAYAKALTKADGGVLLEGARRFRDDPTRDPDPKYTPYPATWLNQERWTDEPAERTAPEPKGWATLREMHEEFPMNDTETTQIMALLLAAYPNTELPAPTISTWRENLRSVHPADARKVCAKLIRTSTFFPSIAEFFDQEGAVRREREIRGAADRGLPEAEGTGPDYERFMAMLGQLREELALSSARNHWHGPDGPCPKCGGTDGMKRVVGL